MDGFGPRCAGCRQHLVPSALRPNSSRTTQILRRHRRSCCYAWNPTVEDHVHRPTRLGDRRLLVLRIAAVATLLRCAAVSRTPDSTKHSADGQEIDSKLGP